jgi:hypothetical protein
MLRPFLRTLVASEDDERGRVQARAWDGTWQIAAEPGLRPLPSTATSGLWGWWPPLVSLPLARAGREPAPEAGPQVAHGRRPS